MVGFSEDDHLPLKKRFRLISHTVSPKNSLANSRKRRKKTIYLDGSHKWKEVKEESSIPHLSEELVYNILCCASADFLHSVARRVCKCWGMIISTTRFVEAHLLYHSKKSTFISDNSLDHNNIEVRQFELRDHGIFRSRRIMEISTSACVMDSCLGLLLLRANSRFHLVNPATKQHLKLPYGPAKVKKIHSAKIAYIRHSSEIKVICRYDSEISQSHRWIILTVGEKMSWKMLNHTSLKTIPISRDLETPICIGSVVIYWRGDKDNFWAVDVDGIVSVTSVSTLPLQVIGQRYKTLIRKGRDLYLVSGYPHEIVIWKLKDFGAHCRDCEWVEVFRNNDVILDRVIHTWSENHKVLIYSERNKYRKFPRTMAYDFRSRADFELQISYIYPHLLNFMSHTPTLISF